MPNSLLIPAPKEYTPIYCDAARIACALKVTEVKTTVDTLVDRFEKTEGRLFSLMVIALVQLLTIVIGIAGIWMANHSNAVAAAETVVKAIKP
jgi:hypothetical protein